MQDLFSAILADPKTWATIAAGAFLWLWAKVAKVMKDGEECRIDRAKLREVIKRKGSRDLAHAFGANLSEFPTGCRLVQFAFGVDVGDVLHDVGARKG